MLFLIESQNSISTACGSAGRVFGEGGNILLGRRRFGLARLCPAPFEQQPVNPRRLGDVLDALLAEVLEFERQLFHHVIVDPARDAHAARVRQALEPGRDIDAVAENIPVLQHHIADIDADAKLHPAVFFEIVVRMRELVLDVDRALHRRQRAAERGQNAVARGAADPSLMAGDQPVGHATKSRQGRERSFLVDLHHAAVAGDVGGEDGDEFSFKRRGFH